MEQAILNKVSVNLSLEDIKRIIKLALLEDTKGNGMIGSTLPDTYSALKHLVNDEEVKECVGYDKFVLTFFKQYASRLLSINTTTLANEELKQDIETVKNSTSLQNPSSVKELFNSEEYKKLNFRSIFPQELYANSRFIHVRGSYLNQFQSEDVQCRLYLSPKMENIAELSTEIVNRHNAQSLPCYFKFNIDGNDNDRIVLYSEVANAEKHLQVLEEIRREKPHLFTGMNKNPLWADISGVPDIYFGMEPFVSGNPSYGSLRGAIFDEAIYDLKRVYENFDINQDITDEMAERFKKFLDIHCLIHNVDAKNLALNKNNEVGEEQTYPLSLRTSKGKDMPIWAHYINPKTMTVRISSSVLTSGNDLFGQKSESWMPHGALDVSFEEFEMLYQHKQSDFDFSKSEMVRNNICKRIQGLKRQQRIDRALDIISPIARYQNKMMVQRSFDGRALVGGGLVNYNLYKFLPYKVSELLGKIQVQRENRKNNMIDVQLTEDIATLNESVLGGNAKEVQATFQTVLSQMITQATQGNNFATDNNKLDELRIIEDVPISDDSNFVGKDAPKKM